MLRSLQVCRAVAAILVVLYHTSHGIFRLEKYFGHKPFGEVFDLGFTGVDFFFVLSGFIMMHVHAQDIGQPREFGKYLWRRFSRIYPTYWVALALVLPVFFVVRSFGFGWERDPDVIVTSVLLLPHPEWHLVLGVAWTLVYEVFFYVLFGVLILNRRVGIALLLAWTAGIFALPWFEETLHPFVFNSLHVRFLGGIVVALVVARWQIPWPRLVAVAGAVIFFGAGLYHVYGAALFAWPQAFWFTLGSALMVAGLVQAERDGLLTAPRWLVYLGNASYSIYLVHFVTLSMLAKVAKWSRLDSILPSQILFCLHVLGAIAAGCIFHHLVDERIHGWAKRFFAKKPEAAPSTVVAEPARKAA